MQPEGRGFKSPSVHHPFLASQCAVFVSKIHDATASEPLGCGLTRVNLVIRSYSDAEQSTNVLHLGICSRVAIVDRPVYLMEESLFSNLFWRARGNFLGR